MNIVKLGLVALLGAVASAGSAHAYTITGQIQPGTIPFTLETLASTGSSNFTTADGQESIQYVSSGGTGSGVYSGTIPNVAASPFGGGTGNYIAAEPNDEVFVTYATPQTSLDLLWGTVDNYNDIYLSVGGIVIGGADIAAAVPGIVFATSNVAVEISGLPAFTTIGLVSFSQPAFEFVPGTPVPEPASLALLGAGLAGIGFIRRRRAAA